MFRCYALLLKCLQFQMLLMLCTFTAVSVVSVSLMLGSFAILSAVLDTPNFVCSSVCSFRCSDFVHNCQILWCALLWHVSCLSTWFTTCNPNIINNWKLCRENTEGCFVGNLMGGDSFYCSLSVLVLLCVASLYRSFLFVKFMPWQYSL